MWTIGQNNQLYPLFTVDGVPEPFNAPRQQLPQTYWQTGHIDVIRTSTVLDLKSLSGQVILPYMVDPAFTVDIDSPRDWKRAEWLVWHSSLEMVYPGKAPRPLPDKVRLVVMDFDGVLTDNRVWVDESGKETVAAYRSDSLGLAIMRQKTGIESLVLSMETNPVVSARCKKMNVPVLQGITQKDAALTKFLAERNINPAEVVYIGNDVNDLVCFPHVGCAVVPIDAEPDVIKQADISLTRRGGHGAVRELCDILIAKFSK
jgi:YrbI family 3-deoxy-D-manno-octulosonate 8-phosphate phosphatase